MRLINLRTLELEEFHDHVLPSYAILSHTWTDNEMQYADWPAADYDGKRHLSPKIENFCNIAKQVHGQLYGWLDTCCIDKSSSAELTQAINSMYRYYADAAICIVHIADAVGGEPDAPLHTTAVTASEPDPLCSSRWLTRGWTLQELIAPSFVHFYDSRWNSIGQLTPDVASRLSNTTGIPATVLLKTSSPGDWSVATRMSWASRRSTTRIEDQAYSLFGLFDVSLPLVYGEGRRAFVRLQEEIIRRSTDHSIFAWNLLPTYDFNDASFGRMHEDASDSDIGRPVWQTKAELDASGTDERGLGLLAPSVMSFARFVGQQRIVQRYEDVREWIESYEITNLGLRLSLPLIPCTSQLGLYHAILNCGFESDRKGPIALNIKRSSPPPKRQRLHAGKEVNTSIFGVVPLQLLAGSRFKCSALHLGRLSVVDEEELLDHDKSSITILRSHKFSQTSDSKQSSLRRSRLNRTDEPARLKMIFEELEHPRANRVDAFPEQDWDGTSHTWYAGDSPGAISFRWAEAECELTFIFFLGRSWETKFQVVMLEHCAVQSAHIGLSSDEVEVSHSQSLHVCQRVGCQVCFAKVYLNLERTEKMGKAFYVLRISVDKVSIWPLNDGASQTNATKPQTDIQIKKQPRRLVFSRGRFQGVLCNPRECPDEDEDDQGNLSAMMNEKLYLPSSSDNLLMEKKSNRAATRFPVRTNTVSSTRTLARKFSFE